jgi:hypothetical protein
MHKSGPKYIRKIIKAFNRANAQAKFAQGMSSPQNREEVLLALVLEKPADKRRAPFDANELLRCRLRSAAIWVCANMGHRPVAGSRDVERLPQRRQFGGLFAGWPAAGHRQWQATGIEPVGHVELAKRPQSGGSGSRFLQYGLLSRWQCHRLTQLGR